MYFEKLRGASLCLNYEPTFFISEAMSNHQATMDGLQNDHYY